MVPAPHARRAAWALGVSSVHALALLALLGLLAAQATMLAQTVGQAWRLRPATAVVVARGGTIDAAGRMQAASLRYRYPVGTATSASEAYRCPGWVPEDGWAGAGDGFARRTRPGSRIPVWYDPLIPSHGVICRAPPVQWGQAWLAVLAAAGITLATWRPGPRHPTRTVALGAGLALGSGLGAVVLLVGPTLGSGHTIPASRWLLLALGLVALTTVVSLASSRYPWPTLQLRLWRIVQQRVAARRRPRS